MFGKTYLDLLLIKAQPTPFFTFVIPKLNKKDMANKQEIWIFPNILEFQQVCKGKLVFSFHMFSSS
jgi:hypothetical protein